MKLIYLLIISSILAGSIVFYLDKTGFNMHPYAYAPNSRVFLLGQIFGVMKSGNAYALKSMTDSRFPQFAAFYSDNQPREIFDGEVWIKGRIDNIDCESYQTIFNGCVPWIEIEEIESIKK